ncbi:hypothetical protein R3P38DRAFT_620637 [Favolaschia claudopus]|uniref:Uncharacterized protein n=1 Tax=Favolaschia claudopus TaxID=2862362 RepID=A0AAW0CBU5_9AGAR
MYLLTLSLIQLPAMINKKNSNESTYTPNHTLVAGAHGCMIRWGSIGRGCLKSVSTLARYVTPSLPFYPPRPLLSFIYLSPFLPPFLLVIIHRANVRHSPPSLTQPHLSHLRLPHVPLLSCFLPPSRLFHSLPPLPLDLRWTLDLGLTRLYPGLPQISPPTHQPRHTLLFSPGRLVPCPHGMVSLRRFHHRRGWGRRADARGDCATSERGCGMDRMMCGE